MRKQLLFTIVLSLTIGFLSAQTFVIDEFTGNASSGIGAAEAGPEYGAGVSTITYENDMLRSDYAWTNSDWFPRSVFYYFDAYQDFSGTPTLWVKFMVTDNDNDTIPVRLDLFGEGMVNDTVRENVETNARPWELKAVNGEWYDVMDDFTANNRWACTYWNAGIPESKVDSTRIKGFEAFSHYGNAAFNNQAGTLYIDYIKMTSPVGVEEVIYGKINEFALAVYPNPANDAVTVNAENIIANIKVFDVTGRLVESFTSVNAKKTQIDITELTGGLYFVNVEDMNGKFVSKKLQVK